MRRIHQVEFPGSQYESFQYPGGEHQVRIKATELSALAAADVVILHAQVRDGELMKVVLLCDALHRAMEPEAELHLVLPYLPYGRADRRFVPGDCFGLKAMCEVLAYSCRLTSVVTLDGHSTVAQKFLPNFLDVSARSFIESVYADVRLRQQVAVGGLFPPPALLFPDEGAKQRYSKQLPYLYATQASKLRDPETGALSGFKVPEPVCYRGSSCIVVIDDICDGGGTFKGIAKALRESGNKLPLYLYTTHGIYSKGVTTLLEDYEHLYCTDSWGLKAKQTEGLTVLPCRGALLDAIIKRDELWQQGSQR